MRESETNDTHPRVQALLLEGYRRMSGAEKQQRVAAMTRAVRELALADVRRRHPDDSPRDQELRAASRWIPADLMLAAFGWNVRERGY